MILKLAALAALVAVLASPALAGGQLPDGTYDCMLDNGYLAGSMEIAGNSYKGPAFDGKYDGAYPFETGPGGGLFLKGPVGGYTDPGFQFIGALIAQEGDHLSIELHVKQDGSDNIHSVLCSPRA